MSSLDRLASLIDWTPIEALLDDIHVAAKGERTWPPLALFKAMLIAVWYEALVQQQVVMLAPRKMVADRQPHVAGGIIDRQEVDHVPLFDGHNRLAFP